MLQHATNFPYEDPGVLQAQSSSNPLPHHLLKVIPPLPPHLGSLNIGRTLVIRLRQHTHNADQNLLRTLNGTPPLAGGLVMIRIVSRRMQNGDAHFPVWIHVWVEDLTEEFHGWW